MRSEIQVVDAGLDSTLVGFVDVFVGTRPLPALRGRPARRRRPARLAARATRSGRSRWPTCLLEHRVAPRSGAAELLGRSTGSRRRSQWAPVGRRATARALRTQLRVRSLRASTTCTTTRCERSAPIDGTRLHSRRTAFIARTPSARRAPAGDAAGGCGRMRASTRSRRFRSHACFRRSARCGSACAPPESAILRARHTRRDVRERWSARRVGSRAPGRRCTVAVLARARAWRPTATSSSACFHRPVIGTAPATPMPSRCRSAAALQSACMLASCGGGSACGGPQR